MRRGKGTFYFIITMFYLWNYDLPKPLWGRLVSLNSKFKNVELREEEVVVGRSANQCSVVIDSPNVSGKHCIIFRQKNEYPAKGGAERKIDYTVMVKDTRYAGLAFNL